MSRRAIAVPFGPNENDKAVKNRAILHLLRLCLELEE